MLKKVLLALVASAFALGAYAQQAPEKTDAQKQKAQARKDKWEAATPEQKAKAKERRKEKATAEQKAKAKEAKAKREAKKETTDGK